MGLVPFFATAQYQFERPLSDYEVEGKVKSIVRTESTPDDNDDKTVQRFQFDESGKILWTELEEVGYSLERDEFVWNDKDQCIGHKMSTEGEFTIYKFDYSKAGLMRKMDLYANAEGTDTAVVRVNSELYAYMGNKKLELHYTQSGKLQSFTERFKNEHKNDTAIYHFSSDSTLVRIERIGRDDRQRETLVEYIQMGKLIGKVEYVYGKNNSVMITRSDASGNTLQQSQENYNKKGLRTYYFLEDELMQFSSEYKYEYEYDSKGNWIKRTTTQDGKLFLIETRKIEYFE